MKVGIVGCGLIGAKRAAALGEYELACVHDTDASRARALAEHCKADVAKTWEDLVQRKDVDAVIVATPHDALAKITQRAVASGKHVLVEKPGARNAKELRPVVELARKNKCVVRVGFNHRFHPALQAARDIAMSAAMGPLMFIRARYGHGGRVGYEKEWRANFETSGGGEAIDQGIHLVDLSRWFLGDLQSAAGYAPTYFWDMQVEDNAFMLLKSRGGQAAWLHASWTEWKNIFSFEIYGRYIKLQVEGLGGSYGMEKLIEYRMSKAMGPPETINREFAGPDESWKTEFEHFVAAIQGRKNQGATLDDALAALVIIDEVKRKPEA